jgi:Fur family ferric uptake transcriptional regulator
MIVLRIAKLRVTPTRLAVLDEVYAASRPLSHAEVSSRLASKDPATVFRALGDLVKSGLLTRLDAGDRIWRFEAAPDDATWHAHFVCTRCRSISCLRDVDIALPTRGVPVSVKQRQVHVFLHGRCDNCGRRS